MRPEIPFLGKFGPKNQNCQFKVKLDIYANLSMQNSMVMFTFFSFLTGSTLFGQFGPKNQNCQFKMKLDTYTNPNIHNSMVMFTFFCFWPEILFLGKFGPKSQNCQFKVKLLRWNLILALIRICRIQWWCLLFSFSTGNTLFGKSGPKNQDCHLKAKLGT